MNKNNGDNLMTTQTKQVLPDGYIEFSNIGNTYCGAMAHEIMHKAELIQRKIQRALKVDVSFNQCLMSLLNELTKQGKI